MMITEQRIKELQEKSITTQEQLFTVMTEILFDMYRQADLIGVKLVKIEWELRELKSEIGSMNRREE